MLKLGIAAAVGLLLLTNLSAEANARPSFSCNRHGLTPDDVLKELERRDGTSGIAEKAARK